MRISIRRQKIATHEPPTSDKTSPERGFGSTLPPSRAVTITFLTWSTPRNAYFPHRLAPPPPRGSAQCSYWSCSRTTNKTLFTMPISALHRRRHPRRALRRLRHVRERPGVPASVEERADPARAAGASVRRICVMTHIRRHVPSRVMWRARRNGVRYGVALVLVGTYSSERAQPLQQRRVIAPDCAFGECPIALCRWQACFECLLLHCEGDLRVPIGGVQTHVTQPVTDDIGLDTSFEKMDCGGMGFSINYISILYIVVF